MPTVQSLKKEIDSLKQESKKVNTQLASFKKNQSILQKKISVLENGQEQEVKKKPTSTKHKSSSPLGGIILVIIGLWFMTQGIGIILGLPLLIIGIVLVSKNSSSTTNYTKKPVKNEKSVTKTASKHVQPAKTIHKKPTSTKHKSSFEEDIGIKWFARIGILALVIGVGFFIKYSIDMNWINHLARIIMGAAFGIGLIVFGEIISKQKKYSNWAKTLVGGGFAITYFVAYASYHFAEYQTAIGISQTLNIILLTTVVILAVIFSLKDNSQIIAAESFFLGYVTTLLSNDLGITTIIYGLLLTIGIVTIVSYKKWSIIGLGGILASYLLYLIWHESISESFTFISVILITYFISFTIQSIYLRKTEFGKNIVVVLFNSAAFFILYFVEIENAYPELTGLFSLCFAVFYLLGYVAYQKIKDQKFATTYIYLALLYITLTIPIQLNNEWITIVWAVEALILSILFVKFKTKTLKISSYVVGAIAGFKTLVIDSVTLHQLDFSNVLASTRIFSFIVTIICFYLIAKLLKDNTKLLSRDESAVPALYSFAATGLLVFIILLELIVEHSAWVSLFWASIAITLLITSKLKSKGLVIQSTIVSVLLFTKIVLYDSFILGAFNAKDILSSTRLISYAIAIIAFYLMYTYIKKMSTLSKTNFTALTNTYSWAACILIVLLIFIELAIDHSVWITVLLSAASLIYMAISASNKKEMANQSIVISAIVFFKVFFIDSSTLAEFNYTDLLASTKAISFVISIITMYTLSWMISNKKQQINGLTKVYSYAGTALSFLLVAIELEEFWISIGWSILALLLIVSGFYVNKKHLRMQGMLIFAIVILKVFLYDIRNLEAIYRTISYMVLGVILLLVSFIYTKYKDKVKKIL